MNNPKKWMPIHEYKEPVDDLFSWEDEWRTLRFHHLDETGILFDIIQELIKRIQEQK